MVEQKNFERTPQIILLISAVLLFCWTIGLITYFAYFFVFSGKIPLVMFSYYGDDYYWDLIIFYGRAIIDFVLLLLLIRKKQAYWLVVILLGYLAWESKMYLSLINVEGVYFEMTSLEFSIANLFATVRYMFLFGYVFASKAEFGEIKN